jgi:hypothetical protein
MGTKRFGLGWLVLRCFGLMQVAEVAGDSNTLGMRDGHVLALPPACQSYDHGAWNADPHRLMAARSKRAPTVKLWKEWREASKRLRRRKLDLLTQRSSLLARQLERQEQWVRGCMPRWGADPGRVLPDPQPACFHLCPCSRAWALHLPPAHKPMA